MMIRNNSSFDTKLPLAAGLFLLSLAFELQWNGDD
jgi:hypothetical protein